MAVYGHPSWVASCTDLRVFEGPECDKLAIADVVKVILHCWIQIHTLRFLAWEPLETDDVPVLQLRGGQGRVVRDMLAHHRGIKLDFLKHSKRRVGRQASHLAHQGVKRADPVVFVCKDGAHILQGLQAKLSRVGGWVSGYAVQEWRNIFLPNSSNALQARAIKI